MHVASRSCLIGTSSVRTACRRSARKRSHILAAQPMHILRRATAVGSILALSAGTAFASQKRSFADEPSPPVRVGTWSATYEANKLNEDRFFIHRARSSEPADEGRRSYVSPSTLVAGVFDGHGGTGCSTYSREEFLRYSRKAVDQISDIRSWNKEDMEKLFLDIDERFWKQRVTNFGDSSGACAVLAVVKAPDSVLVAHAGDCRAVLGIKKKTDKFWTTVSLTNPHQADSLDERNRMDAEHPKEDIVINGRVLGILQPSRALGDFIFKKKDAATVLYSSNSRLRNFYSKVILTPPYVTAMPEVTEYKLPTFDRDSGEEMQWMLILASDGIWDEWPTESEVVRVTGHALSIHRADPNIDVAKYVLKQTLHRVTKRILPYVEVYNRDYVLAQLSAIPPGRRRDVHDDMTLVVIAPVDEDEEIAEVDAPVMEPEEDVDPTEPVPDPRKGG